MALLTNLSVIIASCFFSFSLLLAAMMMRIIEIPEFLQNLMVKHIVQMPKWQAQRLLVVAIATMAFFKYWEHTTDGPGDGQTAKKRPGQVDIVRIMKLLAFLLVLSIGVIPNGYILCAVMLALPSLSLMYFVAREKQSRQQYFEYIKTR